MRCGTLFLDDFGVATVNKGDADNDVKKVDVYHNKDVDVVDDIADVVVADGDDYDGDDFDVVLGMMMMTKMVMMI